ncbi:MAG: C-terminal binding protein [Thermomicrobiales bacterium]
MQQRVVITYGKYGETSVESAILEEAGFEVILASNHAESDRPALWRSADALMVGIDVWSRDIINTLEKCKIICRVGTGFDAIDIPAAEENGIWVTNVPDYSIDEVSSHAIALVMAQARYLFPHRNLGHSGNWRYRAETPIRRLSSQTLGVIGLGRIGKASARKGKGLGLRVIANDPFIPDSDFDSVGAEKVEFDTVMHESDYITLHVPLYDGTRKLIDARALSLMKPTAFLVNTARGEVVDVPALVEAVRAGVLAGAALDVLPVEPPDPDDPVLHDERIIVTPHIGWDSVEAGHDSRVRASEDVMRVLRGERPKYPLNEVRSGRREVTA